MSTVIDGLLFAWKKNLDYGTKLVADLDDEQMAIQPAPGMNHPAWVFSHLNAYLPVIVCVIQGEPFDDPKDHPFGMQSKPLTKRSVYPPKDELMSTFITGHERVEQVLREAGDTALDQPVTLPRWKEVMPVAGIALPYLMLVHENTHFGQISAWRRVQGLPSV